MNIVMVMTDSPDRRNFPSPEKSFPIYEFGVSQVALWVLPARKVLLHDKPKSLVLTASDASELISLIFQIFGHSKLDFPRDFANEARLTFQRIEPGYSSRIPGTRFPSPTERGLSHVLWINHLSTLFGIPIHHWDYLP